MRLRSLVIFKLGFWAGMLAAAAFARRTLPSHGDEESDELSLLAVFDGIELKSRAQALRGGTIVTWFGGIAVDLRDAKLAADARLSVHTLFGGVAVKTPRTWRVESTLKAFAGGVDARSPAGDDPAAPVLRIEGTALFGGVAVGSGS
jgi:hypothetical protein